MKLATKNTREFTYSAVPGIFRDGVAIPSTFVPTTKPAKVIIVFTQPVDNKDNKKEEKKELTEEEVVKIVADGKRAYKKGETENYDKWMIREHFNIYKANRPHVRKN